MSNPTPDDVPLAEITVVVSQQSFSSHLSKNALSEMKKTAGHLKSNSDNGTNMT